MTRTRPYDSAEYLDTPEAIAEYLTEALESDDIGFIMRAIGTVARARGMTQVAREAGVSHENLYRSLSGDTHPEFDTIRRVLTALGVKLQAEPIESDQDDVDKKVSGLNQQSEINARAEPRPAPP